MTCLDCHSNFHTNAAFHLTPDVRPQAARFRLDTTSLRGMFNQQIHGSKRSLRSVEDFTEFEQRTAYFNGDHVSATRKGVHLPDRPNQVAMMAQMQNMHRFPAGAEARPAWAGSTRRKATEQELAGEQIFMGKGRCAECHIPQTAFMDNKMHDLKLERFYEIGQTVNGLVTLPDGAIKTFTLRGIKDSPPYLHDGRLHDARRHRRVLQPGAQPEADQAEKDSLGRLHAGAMRRSNKCVCSQRLRPFSCCWRFPLLGKAGNPAGMTPGTGPLQPNNSDRVFVRAAAIGGMAEVELGKLAQQKAQSDAVKDFARLMVEDHSKANDLLISLAKEDGIAVPGELDQEHKAMRDRIEVNERHRVRSRLPAGTGGGPPKDVAAPGVRDRVGPGYRAQELRFRDFAGRASASSHGAGDPGGADRQGPVRGHGERTGPSHHCLATHPALAGHLIQHVHVVLSDHASADTAHRYCVSAKSAELPPFMRSSSSILASIRSSFSFEAGEPT